MNCEDYLNLNIAYGSVDLAPKKKTADKSPAVLLPQSPANLVRPVFDAQDTTLGF